MLDANYWQNITQFETVGCSRVYPFPNGAPNDGMYLYEDDDFKAGVDSMIPLVTPPFYAIRNASLALSTLDGVRIDTHSHAIDADGEPFEGLYVIGDSSGSYFAHSYPNLCTGYAHGRTCTFARRVAREINGEEVKDYTIMAK